MRIQLEEPNVVNVDEALDRIGGFTTGGSGNGWSRWSAFEQCEYKGKRLYEESLKPRNPHILGAKALEIGTIDHAFLQQHYLLLRAGDKKRPRSPETIRDALLDHGAWAEHVYEAWRVFEAYRDWSCEDVQHVNFVEQHGTNAETGYTCRWDLGMEMVEWRGVDPKLAGFWLVDHKTSGRFDELALECWSHNGEILGQQWIAANAWRDEMDAGRAPLTEVYAFRGTIINILGKQKVPKFHRAVVPYDPERVADFGNRIRRDMAEETLCRVTDSWPRRNAACIQRYGKCPFYEECHR